MMNLSALATGSFLLNSTMKSPLMTSSPATDNSIFDDVITKKYLRSSSSSNRNTTASDEKVCEFHPLGFAAEFFIILPRIGYKYISFYIKSYNVLQQTWYNLLCLTFSYSILLYFIYN